MAIDEAARLARALAEAAARRAALGLPNLETDAYRLIHGAADGFEGLTVDVYGRYLVASLYTEQRGAREDTWLRALEGLGYEGIYLKQRPKQANQLDGAERKARAPEHAVVGHDAPESLIIHEHGASFAVRLGAGLSTGLFLDQRDNRARFAAAAKDKRVLNLFAYTCAFGVVAARAGAAATVNIDVAKPALERGRENYALSGVSAGEHHFLARDVLEALPRMRARGEKFDLIALDPPSYASTKRGRFSVERDYASLAGDALALLVPGGTLLACVNHARMSERDLQGALRAAASAVLGSVASRTLRIAFVAPPPDHPTAPGRPPHLKSAWIST